ncbi:2-dehydro-3-deoxy-D-gluconate 5-dehydrogenase KduD [Candidatus Neomarinimicrobiota bacterium]
MDKFKLDGKVAIVTGASKGLGKSIAVGLAEAGADVCLVARGDQSSTAQQIEALGRKVLPITADLGQRDQVLNITKSVVDHFGRVDTLVNNAGMTRRAPIVDFTTKDWDEVIEVNQTAPFLLSQAVAKQYIAQGNGGKIINIASMQSYQGGISICSYTASKHAISGLTKIMANELASKNINVNAIAPGYMATEITAPLRADVARNKAILERIPAGHWGAPDDIQGLAVFLASDAAAYLHGFTIAIDGGWLAR